MTEDVEIYEAVGGDAPFVALVDAFYAGVEGDAKLRALYPADLGPGKQHLAWFLIQRFGGPDLFSQRRGAPMLRMRHREFAIDPAMRDAWVKHMLAAVDVVPEFTAVRGTLRRYFEDAATFLINRDPLEPGRARLNQL
jgi:hemoglobin